MSTMKVTNLKHESSASNNIVLNSDGSVGGELATTLASKADYPSGGSDGDALLKSGTDTVWGSAGALQLVHAEAFTAVAGVNLNNVFDSTYANYRVVVRFTDFSADTNVNVRLRASGGSDSNNLYQQQSFYYVSGTSVASLDSGVNTLMLATKVDTPNWEHNYLIMDILGPQPAVPTLISWRASLSLSGTTVAAPVVGHCTFNGTTSFDGVAVYVTTGLETGDIRVYGYEN